MPLLKPSFIVPTDYRHFTNHHIMISLLINQTSAQNRHKTNLSQPQWSTPLSAAQPGVSFDNLHEQDEAYTKPLRMLMLSSEGRILLQQQNFLTLLELPRSPLSGSN